MPRNVRNFWLEIEVDGRKSRIGVGPVRKNGGFTLSIRQRDDGQVTKPMVINGFADDMGNIRLEVMAEKVQGSHKVIWENKTKR